ncbi:MAG: four helix bundle protein [Candidatus Tantalella remota]|nr:four helix bundle protein [Candidatus Tantalella remota]
MTNDKIQNSNEIQNPDDKTRKFDLYDRSLDFAVRSVKLLKTLPSSLSVHEYSKQLIRSSSSIGTNVEEADGTLTKKAFADKMGIARREARESRHWLNLIKRTQILPDLKKVCELDQLINEAKELMLIISSIINKVLKK